MTGDAYKHITAFAQRRLSIERAGAKDGAFLATFGKGAIGRAYSESRYTFVSQPYLSSCTSTLRRRPGKRCELNPEADDEDRHRFVGDGMCLRYVDPAARRTASRMKQYRFAKAVRKANAAVIPMLASHQERPVFGAVGRG